jgi:hypothetical protein
MIDKGALHKAALLRIAQCGTIENAIASTILEMVNEQIAEHVEEHHQGFATHFHKVFTGNTGKPYEETGPPIKKEGPTVVERLEAIVESIPGVLMTLPLNTERRQKLEKIHEGLDGVLDELRGPDYWKNLGKKE